MDVDDDEDVEAELNGLKSEMTFRGGDVGFKGEVERVWEPLAGGGDDGVGGAPGTVGRGGSRPPGTYWNAPFALFRRKLSVNRLMGTYGGISTRGRVF